MMKKSLFIILLCLVLFHPTSAVPCPTQVVQVTLAPQQNYVVICETAADDGHLLSYSLTATPFPFHNSLDVIAERAYGTRCYTENGINSSPRWTNHSCFNDTGTCNRTYYNSMTPICVIIFNNATSNSYDISGNVSFLMGSTIDPLLPLEYYLPAIGADQVWEKYNLSGAGIVIDLISSGRLYLNHEDLLNKVRLDLSYDYQTMSNYSSQTGNSQTTTALAGLITSNAGNSICGKGIAYNAALAAHRVPRRYPQLLADSFYDLSHGDPQSIHISTVLTGMPPLCFGLSFCNYWPDSQKANNQFITGVTTGRNGSGRIYVFSGGNNVATFRPYDSNCNMNPYAKQRQVIAVAGIAINGVRDRNSAIGSCLLVNAPSGGRPYGSRGRRRDYGAFPTIATYSHVGCQAGYRGGGLAASGVVSGVIALMLEANPLLSWRDVQWILAATAIKNDPSSPTWIVNGAQRAFSLWYGFGQVNASAAVAMSYAWANQSSSLGPELHDTSSPINLHKICIPDNITPGPQSMLTVANSKVTTLETVAVILNIKHQKVGDLRITLQSPMGTTLLLKNNTPSIIPPWAVNRIPIYLTDFYDYVLTARGFAGESPLGTWTLTVSDVMSNQIEGQWVDWTLDFYGTGQSTNQPTYSTVEQPSSVGCLSSSDDSSSEGTNIREVVVDVVLLVVIAVLIGVIWYQRRKPQSKTHGLLNATEDTE